MEYALLTTALLALQPGNNPTGWYGEPADTSGQGSEGEALSIAFVLLGIASWIYYGWKSGDEVTDGKLMVFGCCVLFGLAALIGSCSQG